MSWPCEGRRECEHRRAWPAPSPLPPESKPPPSSLCPPHLNILTSHHFSCFFLRRCVHVSDVEQIPLQILSEQKMDYTSYSSDDDSPAWPEKQSRWGMREEGPRGEDVRGSRAGQPCLCNEWDALRYCTGAKASQYCRLSCRRDLGVGCVSK